MNYFKQFLESSTIHGLVYISTESKIARFFWILVVATGFTIATLLIQQSFSNWSESPIKTTIETRPISEITFPKVTVCPPKNTFTDLNYDIMMLENKTMTNETRHEFLETAKSVFQESYLENVVLANLSMLDEDNRFYNWYHGYTWTLLPYWKNSYYGQYYEIYTSITSGSIKTKYFGDKYNPAKIERKLYYRITISPPKQVLSKCVMTLEIEKVSMKVAAYSRETIMIHANRMISVDATDANFLLYNLTFHIIGNKDMTMTFQRDVNSRDIEANQNLDTMPGFKIKWKLDQIAEPDAKYLGKETNVEYKRVVELSKNVEDFNSLWKIASKIKQNYDIACERTIPHYKLVEQVTLLQNESGLITTKKTNSTVEISLDILKKAANILLHLSVCFKPQIGLEFLEQLAITRDMKQQMIDKVVLNVHDLYFENEVLANLSMLEEENRFYNWYYGYTEVKFPDWGNYEDVLNQMIDTSATSGSIKTRYFGDKYNPDKIERNLKYTINIHTPDQAIYDYEYTLMLEIEVVWMKLSEDSKESMAIDHLDYLEGVENLDTKQKYFHRNFSGLDSRIVIKFERDVTTKDIETTPYFGIKKAPGFKIKWSYNRNDVQPDAKFNENQHTRNTEFRRLVNMFLKSNESIWTEVRKKRLEFLEEYTESSCSGGLRNFIEGVEDDSNKENIDNEKLQTPGKILAYLSFCPPKEEMDNVAEEKENSLKTYTPKELVIILNRLLHAKGKSLPYRHEYNKILNEVWYLRFKEIKKLTQNILCKHVDEECQDPELMDNEYEHLSLITNHPVHVIQENNNLSPSSFIPFCWFGREKKLNAKNERFQFDACNSFLPKLFYDQICYEINPNEHLLEGQNSNKVVLYLIIDENKDRQITSLENGNINTLEQIDEQFMLEDLKQSDSVIYLDTIDSLQLSPGWKYNLNALKKIKGSEDFLLQADSDKDCQLEHFDNCTTRSYVERVLKKCSCLPLSMQLPVELKEGIYLIFVSKIESYFQAPLCKPSQLRCTKEVKIDDGKCRKSCEGIYVTSYFKSKLEEETFADFLSRIKDEYMQYKNRKNVDFPEVLKGYEWKDSLKIVGIYIDTPAFDEVTKDVAATFTDRLSTIGGTFGLLTGFSLISGVEIIFFVTKFLVSLTGRKQMF